MVTESSARQTIESKVLKDIVHHGRRVKAEFTMTGGGRVLLEDSHIMIDEEGENGARTRDEQSASRACSSDLLSTGEASYP